MNPNLVLFLKKASRHSFVLSFVVIVIYFMTRSFTDRYDALWELVWNGILISVTVIGAGVALVATMGSLVKDIFTTIMKRADSIVWFSEDSNKEGIHIITRHHYSGGDSDGSHYFYLHYYIVMASGKQMLVVNETGIENRVLSLKEISRKMNKPLRFSEPIAISSLPDKKGESEYTDMNIPIHGYSINLQSFTHWIDFGFSITCHQSNGRVVWKKKV